jgi:hypothetical protein
MARVSPVDNYSGSSTNATCHKIWSQRLDAVHRSTPFSTGWRALVASAMCLRRHRVRGESRVGFLERDIDRTCRYGVQAAMPMVNGSNSRETVLAAVAVIAAWLR